MDIGPNLAGVLVQALTLAGVIFAAVMTYLTNRKAKENAKGIARIEDGITADKKAAQTAQANAEIATAEGVGRAAQVAVERTNERARSVARVLQAGEDGKAAGIAQEQANPSSGFMPLEP